ncbi:MAG: selenocysteine-specific translation elongation factor [Rhodanobacteraceae bacterium]
MIVGTAGHIDHGKTTLVRALTGVDTDRLAEEKARGISIELGYAYVPLASGDVLGFVDVPGHERLVHTMVAGASGIDCALLVVAADDGVMPQTREHLAILELLGIARGAIALTKIDRVDGARLRTVTEDIGALLSPTPLAGSPIFPVDARLAGDERTRALRTHLEQEAATLAARSPRGLFRLAIDRVFTLPGHGTIATGTVVSGEVRIDETVSIMPSGRSARVRGIHAQNRPAEVGRAGERCAINLANVEKSALARGDWLADPRALVPSSRIDAALRTTRDAPPLVDGAPIHLHLGTAHATARVITLAHGRAQLVVDKPICSAAGDRFIVRDAQATRTLGGGTVLDPVAPSRRRRSVERMRHLDAIERLLAGEGIAALIAQAPYGVREGDLVRLANDPEVARHLPAGAERLDSAAPVVIGAARLAELRERILAAVAKFHVEAPDEPGVGVSRLHRTAAPDAPAEVWTAVVDRLVAESALVRNGAFLRLADHRVRLTDREAGLAGALLPRIVEGRFDPPWVRDLAATVAAPEDDVRRTLRKLNAQGDVHQIVRDLFYAPERVRELAAIAREIAERHGSIDAGAFRDAIGLGRKRTVQLLEFFDRVGYTRRVRDTHRLRGESGVSF